MLKKIVIGFGLLVLIAVVVIYGKYFFSKAMNARAAVKNVNEQHAAADIEGDQIFRSRISSLQQLGIMGAKVAESKADTCYIGSVDGGFVTIRYEQRCKLDYVAGYTALLSREETFARLQTLPKRKPTFNLYSRPADGRCVYRMQPFWEAGSLRRIPAENIPKSNDCRIPDLINGSPRPIARIPQSTSFDYTFDPDATDQSVDLLWITYSHIYYWENLGCTPDPFCFSSPRSTPIQAD
jgi:hypothetical protein